MVFAVGLVACSASTKSADAPVTHGGATSAPAQRIAGAVAVTSRPFDVAIRAAPAIDPRSVTIVRNLLHGRPLADLGPDGIPVYTADAATPQYQVRCTEPWGPCPLSLGPVPVPAGARPSTGTDHSLVIIDPHTGLDYELWLAAPLAAGGWQAAWGAVEPLNGDGVRGINGSIGASGSGLSFLAGIVRTGEIAAGVIPHALVISSLVTCATVFRYPAVKTDGRSTAAACIPEGTRLQLDPSVNVDAIPGITPAERSIAARVADLWGLCSGFGRRPPRHHHGDASWL